MKAISQTQSLGVLAGSVLLVAGALAWIALGAAPVRAESGSHVSGAVQDKHSEALELKLLMHRFGATVPQRP